MLRAGRLEELQTIPTLPQDFKGENLCADLHISRENIYMPPIVGMTASSAISSMKISGIDLSKTKFPPAGKEPRNFAIDPTGNFLLAANRKVR